MERKGNWDTLDDHSAVAPDRLSEPHAQTESKEAIENLG